MPGRIAWNLFSSGPELRLNSRPIDHLTGVSVVGLADASFVAVWLGVTPGSAGTTVLRARRFSPSGKPLGPDFDVNTMPLGGSAPNPGFKVAAAPGGGFVVAWGFSPGSSLRWFNASGTPLGPERMASAPSASAVFPESLAFDDKGNLLLLLNLDDEALQLQLFDPQGTPQGPPVDVNDDDTEQPLGGGVAWTGDSWLVTWVAAIREKVSGPELTHPVSELNQKPVEEGGTCSWVGEHMRWRQHPVYPGG